MAIESSWEEAGGLYWKYSGTLVIEDIMRANLKVMGDHRMDEVRYVIADFHDVERSSISPDDVIKIAVFDEAATRSLRCLKIAFVVHGETQQALAKLYELKSREGTSWEYRSFSCAEDARAWLSVAIGANIKEPQLTMS